MKRFLVLMFCLLLPVAANAKPASELKPKIPNIKPLTVTYDVYVGGIHFLTADIFFEEQKQKYHSIVTAHTYGFLYKVLPWDTRLEATGKIVGDHFVPADFKTRDEFKHKAKSVHMLFDKKGNITTEFDPPTHDDKRDMVTQDQSRGALDPVTALLQLLAYGASNNSCDVSVPVFDGKRRFDITASGGGMDAIDEGEYSVYKGQARICDANFTMIAGAWKEGEKSGFWRKNDTEAGRDPFHIWLAHLAPELPEMPVRLESGSVWGLIVMHMSKWSYAAPTAVPAAKPLDHAH